MKWLDNMNNAIEYIEKHLDEKIDYNKVAQAKQWLLMYPNHY